MFLHCHCEVPPTAGLRFTRNDILFNAFVLVLTAPELDSLERQKLMRMHSYESARVQLLLYELL